MKVPFRHGLVSFAQINNKDPLYLRKTGTSSTYIDLIVNDKPVIAAVAHGQSDYLITETKTVVNAWGPLKQNTNYWLYWELDSFSGARTFGHTISPPITAIKAPLQPVMDQHWFDSSTTTMRVFNGSTWVVKIRVFAGYTQANTLYHYGEGSQVQLTRGRAVGRIVFDDGSKPVRKRSGEFFTTEDAFFTSGSHSQVIKMEYAVTGAVAREPMSQFSVVKYYDFDEIVLAGYDDVGSTTLAVVTTNLVTGEVGDVVFSGVLTNSSWKWPVVNAPLWINDTGEFALTPIVGKAQKPPVARVVGEHSILFGATESAPSAQPVQPGSTKLPTIVKYPAGNTIGGHRVVLLVDGVTHYADSTNINNAQRVLGISTGAAVMGADLEVQTLGEIEEPTWNWELNLPIFLGPNGTLTQVVPTSPTAAFCLVIGLPVTSTKMYISIREPIALSTGE